MLLVGIAGLLELQHCVGVRSNGESVGRNANNT